MTAIDAYAQVADLRIFQGLDSAASPADPQDANRALALEAASRAVDRAANQTFRIQISGGTSSASLSDRYFTRYRDGRLEADGHLGFMQSLQTIPYLYALTGLDALSVFRAIVLIDPVFTTYGLTVALDTDHDDTYATTTTSFRLMPINASAYTNQPWTGLLFNRGVVVPSGDLSVKVTAAWGYPAIPNTIMNACLIQANRFFVRKDAPFGIAGSPTTGSEMRLQAVLDPDVAVMVGPFKKWWSAA